MTEHALAAASPARRDESVVRPHRLGAQALLAIVVILAAVALVVLASAEWMAPAAAGATPG